MSHTGILITGGTGFLARGLVRRLLANGEERIRIFSRGEHAQARMRSEFGEDRGVGYFIGDVRDQERLERAMHRVDVVIHAAALKRIEVGHYNPDEMVKTNVLGAMNVLEAANRAGVRRLVLVSSDKAFQPVSPYGLSKALAEHLFLAANRMNLGPRAVVCRYGNVAGSTGSVIPIWREIIAKGLPVPVTDPECTRFWMSLEQAVELVVSAIDGEREMLIPTLPAFRLGDLAAAMDAEMMVLGLNGWEKKHEAMDSTNRSELARRMSLAELRAGLEAL
jgi:UDP-N-acetylglucosamine 4,6-dehydratase